METISEKEKNLFEILRAAESAVIAFSGGVDSSYLLWAAREILGARALAVTLDLATVPRREKETAGAFCRERHISHKMLAVDQTEIPGFSENPKDRCYLCKRALFETLKREASREGFATVADGTNADDAKGYRPGLRALTELGIRSPLREANLSKEEIRELSHRAGLATWDAPSFACMATRFPYGTRITPEGLSRVEAAEDFLREKGFAQFRVRVHGDLARIELPPEDFRKFSEIRTETATYFRKIGFLYVTLDAEGFRSGSFDRDK